MVWATFEHVDNAPDGPCTGPTAPPPGFTGWAFNKASQTSCSNINNFPSGQQPPYPITQAFRNWALGTGPGSSTNNAATIQSLNNSVMGLLPANSVWKNYFLVGAIWTTGQLPAVAPPASNANEKGSTFLANVTMETFTQTPNPQGSASTENCFTCHNAMTTSTNPPNPPAVKVSHALVANSGSCPYSTTLPPACAATQAGLPSAKSAAAADSDSSPVAPVPAHRPVVSPKKK
jgi:hypothetical protein